MNPSEIYHTLLHRATIEKLSSGYNILNSSPPTFQEKPERNTIVLDSISLNTTNIEWTMSILEAALATSLLRTNLI